MPTKRLRDLDHVVATKGDLRALVDTFAGMIATQDLRITALETRQGLPDSGPIDSPASGDSAGEVSENAGEYPPPTKDV